MRLLVVDDSKAMRMIVIRTIRQAGYGDETAVDQAGSAAEALEVVKATPPDLVLSDWNMPGGTGLDLLKGLREAGSNVAFGFVTSEGSDEMRQMAKDAGALFLITKPFTPETFRDALGSVIPG
jgi:two-component system, chemotaxis family, chemotaxis protein CheY